MKPCYVLTITDNVQDDDISVEKHLEKDADDANENAEEAKTDHLLNVGVG